MKLTKKERNQVYRESLEYIMTTSEIVGLCNVIRYYSNLDATLIHKVSRYYPEIVLFKPERPNNFRPFWWDLDDKESRIIALQLMIEMTNE